MERVAKEARGTEDPTNASAVEYRDAGSETALSIGKARETAMAAKSPVEKNRECPRQREPPPRQ